MAFSRVGIDASLHFVKITLHLRNRREETGPSNPSESLAIPCCGLVLKVLEPISKTESWEAFSRDPLLARPAIVRDFGPYASRLSLSRHARSCTRRCWRSRRAGNGGALVSVFFINMLLMALVQLIPKKSVYFVSTR